MRVLVLYSRYRSGPTSGENHVVDDEVRLLCEAGHEVRLLDPEAISAIRAAFGVVWDAHRAAVAHWAAVAQETRASSFGVALLR